MRRSPKQILQFLLYIIECLKPLLFHGAAQCFSASLLFDSSVDCRSLEVRYILPSRFLESRETIFPLFLSWIESHMHGLSLIGRDIEIFILCCFICSIFTLFRHIPRHPRYSLTMKKGSNLSSDTVF